VASIATLLKAPGRPPARKVLRAILDEFEDILVTQDPIAVPEENAHLPEMKELLRRSLGPELREAIRCHNVSEVEELHQLGKSAQRRIEKSMCRVEMDEACSFLHKQGVTTRQQLWRLLGFCNGETVTWLSVGLLIKVVSQIPQPLRIVYVSATVTAAAKGADGLAEFHKYVIMSFWLFVAEKLLQFAGRITMFRGEQLFTLRLKKEVYAACLRQDMEFYDTHRCGELQMRLDGDTREVCQKVLYFPVRCVQFAFFLVFNLSVVLSTNPKLVGATLSVLPLSLIGNLFLMKRLQRYYNKMHRRAELSASKTQEVLSNIRTVRSFAREPYELQRYMRYQEYEARVLNQVSLLQGMAQPLLHGMGELSFFVGLYYGGLLIMEGLLSSGEVITMVQGTQACTSVLLDLFDTMPEIAKGGKPASRICELLERRPSIEAWPWQDSPSREGWYASKTGKSQIQFNGVHFSYTGRNVEVLKGLRFEAKGGEVVALVGVTGCGKSTIMHLLLRFYSPTSGQIILDGRPLSDYEPHALRSQIGVVSQEPVLFGTSIRENLVYGAPALGLGTFTDDELRELCLLANAWEFIEQLPEGLSTEVGERGVQLSGGQKQRIAIARAMVKRPRVLLLDEATSALDVESEQVVQRALDEVIRSSACTTLVIAHRLATVRTASKIVVISGGIVAEEGTPRDLAARPKGLYARLLKAQSQSLCGSNGSNGSNGNHEAPTNGAAASPGHHADESNGFHES